MLLTYSIWVNFFEIFVVSRNTETVIETNFWLRMYMPYILKDLFHITLEISEGHEFFI